MILLMEIICFFMLHHATKFVDDYPNGWRQIVMYAIGVLFTYPFYLMYLAQNEKPKNAFLLAFLGSGIGTSFGWMSDKG